MDLVQLGLVTGLIFSVGSIVKTSIDIAIKNLELKQPSIYIMNYSLCFLLMLLLVFISTPLGFVPFLQALVGAILAGNYAAMQTDVHNAARDGTTKVPGDTPHIILE